MDLPPKKNIISDRLKVLALVAKPIGEADKGTTFISGRASRFAKGKDALARGCGVYPTI